MQVEAEVKTFAQQHKTVLQRSERQLSASFEIGCLHALMRFYEKQNYTLSPQNLQAGSYLYLTTPQGNPANFSYLDLVGPDGEYQIRQQVRVRSHVDSAIAFTPDLAVLRRDAVISGIYDQDYAAGKKRFFYVDSSAVVAAHECKSTSPFPELFISFLGMLVSAHAWYPKSRQVQLTSQDGHLAPTLFVGGSHSALHNKMILAMQRHYPVNVITGLHRGTWRLTDARNRLVWKTNRTRKRRSPRRDEAA